MRSIGSLTFIDLTSLVLVLDVFSRRIPSSGTKMSSVALIYTMLNGQLVRRLMPTICLIVLIEGRQITRWRFLANLARKYEQRV